MTASRPTAPAAPTPWTPLAARAVAVTPMLPVPDATVDALPVCHPAWLAVIRAAVVPPTDASFNHR